MVHLDIKPANILRSVSGEGIRYKLCDFGLARSKFNINNEDIDEGDSRYLA
jgi:serine/threonine protein kinase